MPGARAKEYELQMNPGDRLFVYTDGIPEAINEAVEQYGPDRLLTILNKDKTAPMEEILPAVREDISDFAGKAEQFDDITMLGFTYHGEA
jgi:serine phosphatase RsbU (regulator of sigma subunit)